MTVSRILRRRAWSATAIALACLAAFEPHVDGRISSGREPARSYLAAAFDLTNVDLERIERGQVVARSLTASDPREFAVFGVVHVAVTPELYVNHLAQIARFKRTEGVLQVGVFGNPPTLDDIGSLTLDDADIRSLRSCRVGNCGVQLSAEAIDRFRQSFDWRRADATALANGLMRQILVDYVAGYQREGPSASMKYADQAQPLNLDREFASLVESSPAIWQGFPTLGRHLLEYPNSASPGVNDLVYWSKEKVGRRGVASITHLVISRPTDGSPADYAIASKQIYGSHYVDASLGLTVLLPDHSGSSPAMYLAYVNRSRVDVFSGMFGGLARSIVTSKARSTVADQLARLRQNLEAEFANRARQ